MTIILNVTSKTIDRTKYTGLLSDGDTLVAVNSLECENIVKRYNEIVAGTDEKSDILLLSDNVKLHDGFLGHMNSCLYAAEKHAIVYGYEIADKESLVKTARKYLPEYSITIYANPNSVMIKRKVINALGFLDESYSSLKYALMDYYCRINIYGFSSVVSHFALYSYNSEKQNVDNTGDKELFESRYEHWADKEERYARHGAHPCIEFLTLIDRDFYPKKRILFDCVIMPPHHCGTSEYQISVFDAFNRLYSDKYDIILYTNYEADEYHGLSKRYSNICYPDTIEGIFHLGFAPNQLVHFDPLLSMNKRCLKIVQTMFDIIMVRVDKHLMIDVNSDVELGIKSSDGIVCISNYTKHDFQACFSNENSIKDKLIKVIYPATELTVSVNDYELPFKEYFLIVGNHFKHKAIKETIEAVSNSRFNFIVIGYEDKEYTYPNIYSYKGGYLEEDFLSFLYANCKAVVFPSFYEGFGLPVTISLKNRKRVILYNSELNKELLDKFSQFKDYFLLFDSFAQIGEIIDNVDSFKQPAPVEYSDSWDRVAIELESFFEEILEMETDPDKLNERWHLFKVIEAKMAEADYRYELQRVELTGLQHQFGEYKLLTLLRFAIKEHIKKRHVKLFEKIKRIFGRK